MDARKLRAAKVKDKKREAYAEWLEFLKKSHNPVYFAEWILEHAEIDATLECEIRSKIKIFDMRDSLGDWMKKYRDELLQGIGDKSKIRNDQLSEMENKIDALLESETSESLSNWMKFKDNSEAQA